MLGQGRASNRFMQKHHPDRRQARMGMTSTVTSIQGGASEQASHQPGQPSRAARKARKGPLVRSDLGTKHVDEGPYCKRAMDRGRVSEPPPSVMQRVPTLAASAASNCIHKTFIIPDDKVGQSIQSLLSFSSLGRSAEKSRDWIETMIAVRPRRPSSACRIEQVRGPLSEEQKEVSGAMMNDPTPTSGTVQARELFRPNVLARQRRQAPTRGPI